MKKKVLLIASAIALAAAAVYALVTWGLSWVWAEDAVASSAARPWPGGLGTIDSVADRFPPLRANEAAVKLVTLMKALPKDELLAAYVAREITLRELTIGEAPKLPDVSPMRELLLREPIVWGRSGGVGEVGDINTSERRVVQMTLARLLVASALRKARENDPDAWEDLHAVWKLARSMDRQPEMMEQTAAFTMTRMINAVAWKMPLPAPAWFAALQEHDSVLRLIEAFQYQVASYSNGGSPMFPTRWHAGSVEHDRRIAEKVFNESRCDVTTEENDLGVDLSFVWRRAFRYRAEREATANALRAREGKAIVSASRCTDGEWTFDGATLRFSREIPTAPRDTPMPLVLRVKQ